MRLLLSGVSSALIDNAGKRLDFKLGPLEFADKLEIQCIINQLDSTDASVASLIRSMQKINRCGLSSNKGFYDYKESKKNIIAVMCEFAHKAEYLYEGYKKIDAAKVIKTLFFRLGNLTLRL